MVNNDLKISIIVPVYNVETYIKQCVSSLLNQTYRNIEVILINDGSTDESGIICDEFAAFDSRIVVIHKNNEGVSAARNIGIENATGDYLCFVDSDDWVDIDYVQKVATTLRLEQPDILLNNYILNYNNGRSVENYELQKECCLSSEEALYATIDNRFVKWNAVATFYAKRIYKEVTFDKNICYGEDLLYKFEVIKKVSGKIYYLPMAKYHYRVRSGSACSSYPLSKKIDDLRVLEYIMDNSSDNIGELTFRKQYISKLINYMYESVSTEVNVDHDLFDYFVDKIKQNRKRALKNNQISISKKLKVLSCYLPSDLLKEIVKIYMKLRENRLSKKNIEV